uniref:Protein kinase domain-containing protein n=1 Tax=Echinostoma caproni TaxID=27848 RepID=A0A183AMT4_9TREM
LTRFSHLKNVVTLVAVYDSDSFVYMVTEYLGGGELLDRVMRKRGLSEFEASRVVEVIAGTLAELHKNRVSLEFSFFYTYSIELLPGPGTQFSLALGPFFQSDRNKRFSFCSHHYYSLYHIDP